MSFKINLIIFSLLFSFNIYAQDNYYKEECAVTKASFDQTFDHFRQMHPNLIIINDWNDDDPKAFASFMRLVVSGGFARKNDISLGGLITVACHEIGHAQYSHNEGEADEFSTRVCMKKFFKDEDHIQTVELYKTLTPDMLQFCDDSFSSRKESALCLRLLVSSFNASSAGRNRCLDRLNDLKNELPDSPDQVITVPNFYYRCLRTDSQFDQPRARVSRILEALSISEDKLLNDWLPITEENRIFNTPYSRHNSPVCRQQTFLHGILDIEAPTCWYL
ncbi:MAG: hypothetical protein HRT44_01520 [Bdellovibrionales bacterium]|nr:hypothetical protein [Bdellovibrionales bacterium]NQZ17925.1 hypothetical protein [Bdellovibrionales bacterium]